MLRVESAKFLGKSRRRWDTGRVLLDVSHYEAGARFPFHYHNDSYFCLPLSGLCEESCERDRYSLTSETLIFHPAGSRHEDRWHQTGKCLNINLLASFVSDFKLDVAAGPYLRFHQHSTVNLARDVYAELLERDTASSLAIDGIVLTMLAHVERINAKTKEGPLWLKVVRERLDDEFLSPPGMADLARDAGVHPTHLASTFRRYFKKSVGEYVRDRRIHRAELLLRQGRTPLGEIAFNLGFADQSHFSRAFKKKTGRSPREYRCMFIGEK